MIVADASVLIVLSKIGRVRLLRLLYEQVVIGPVVKAEVVDRGKAISAAEVRQVEKGLEESWIREVLTTNREKRLIQRILDSIRLGEGEAESLALASTRKLIVLIDDKEARAIAKAMEIEHMGTAGVLLEAFIKRHLTYNELEEAVRDLGGVMWLSPDIVTDIMRTAREVRK